MVGVLSAWVGRCPFRHLRRLQPDTGPHSLPSTQWRRSFPRTHELMDVVFVAAHGHHIHILPRACRVRLSLHHTGFRRRTTCCSQDPGKRCTYVGLHVQLNPHLINGLTSILFPPLALVRAPDPHELRSQCSEHCLPPSPVLYPPPLGRRATRAGPLRCVLLAAYHTSTSRKDLPWAARWYQLEVALRIAMLDVNYNRCSSSACGARITPMPSRCRGTRTARDPITGGE